MLQKTVGIVLHTLKYNDTSNIVEMYTELSGRVSFLVPVPRSRKSAVKSVLFQPLSLIEIEADFRPNATLYKIKEAKSDNRRNKLLKGIELTNYEIFCLSQRN